MLIHPRGLFSEHSYQVSFATAVSLQLLPAAMAAVAFICCFYLLLLLASLHVFLQVSLRESKDGSEAKLEAAKTFSRVIAAGLHRVASAMAKDNECITKANKVHLRPSPVLAMLSVKHSCCSPIALINS